MALGLVNLMIEINHHTKVTELLTIRGKVKTQILIILYTINSQPQLILILTPKRYLALAIWFWISGDILGCHLYGIATVSY